MIRKQALAHWGKKVCAHGDFSSQLLISTINTTFVIKVTEFNKIKDGCHAKLAS